MRLQPRTILDFPLSLFLGLVGVFLLAVIEFAVISEQRRSDAYARGVADASLWAERRGALVADSVFRGLADSVRRAYTIPGSRLPAARFITFHVEASPCSTP